MEVLELSGKQALAMSWWCEGSPWADRDGIICDGAVRSGKTVCLAIGFFCWALERWHGANFAVCARSVNAARRNVIEAIRPTLEALGFRLREKAGRNAIEVEFGGHEDRFYLFGGNDAKSAGIIQGLTLAGVFLDEAALMPQEFVEQAAARCSAEGAKVWMSCNPEGPEHWLYREWIGKIEARRMLRVRFKMEDNPSLSPEVLARYARSFYGTFYQRFVLGEWTAAEGRVYDFFDESYVRPVPEGPFQEWRVSCDYGTLNPTSMGLWGRKEGVWYRVREHYYDARKTGRTKTDLEYVEDLRALCGGRSVERVVVDPSAASFIAALEREGWPVEKADNDVLTGIRRTADLLRRGEIVICAGCEDAIREFGLYCWDERSAGDRVVKRHDHAMDDIRYFTGSLERKGGPWSCYVERAAW